jgi:hypothetical protein
MGAGRPELVSDNSGNPELIEAARSFYGELRRHSEAELNRRVEEIASAYMLRGPCKAGHPVTLENTQRIGAAGYRCRECRRAIARESARKMRILDPERIRENARRNNAKYLRRKRLAEWGYEL